MVSDTPSAAQKRPTKRVRLPFLIAGGIALVGFGAISGVAFDIATRPVPLHPASPGALPEVHLKRQESIPTVVLPETPRTGAIFGSPDEQARAWAPKAPPENTAPTPLVAYAIPTEVPRQHPVIAIVIDDMGVDRTHTREILELPGPLTVSLMTYADDLPALVKRAHAVGDEVMAHLPMEPIDPKENPGPGALTVKMDAATIRKRLALDLDGWSGYVGINNHMGSKFTIERDHMDVVMDELKNRGLMWLDSKTIGGSTGPKAARAANVPVVTRDIFLDDVETEDAIKGELAHLVAIARSHGTAIAIGHPHPATIAVLKGWLPALSSSGVSLVPVTEILRRQQASAHSESGARDTGG